MQNISWLHLRPYLVSFYYWLLRIVALGVSAISLVVALVCSVVALTPIKGAGDSAFYSLAGFIALIALVMFMLAGGVMLQIRIVKTLRGNSADSSVVKRVQPQDLE